MSSVNNRLLRASVDSSGKLQYRAVMHGQGMLSGIGRRVSSLFGILSTPASDTVSLGNCQLDFHWEINNVHCCRFISNGGQNETDGGLLSLPLQLHSVLWSAEACSLYTLTSSSISKWRVSDDGEQQVLSWDVQRALSESIADAIWVSARARPLCFFVFFLDATYF